MNSEKNKFDLKNIKFIKLFASLALCFLAGGIGSFFTYPQINTWYASLKKPFFNPPNWIFGPVWTTLYILMGVSLYLMWTSSRKKDSKEKGIIVFFLQLVLNTMWSLLFFGLHSPFLGLTCIILLWAMILLTMVYFKIVSQLSALLLIPYLLWVSFASVLNLAVFILNR